MVLLKKHRQTLLSKLEKAQDELNINKSIMAKKVSEDMVEYYEIEAFLLNQEIDLIKDSLINNEIDF